MSGGSKSSVDWNDKIVVEISLADLQIYQRRMVMKMVGDGLITDKEMFKIMRMKNPRLFSMLVEAAITHSKARNKFITHKPLGRIHYPQPHHHHYPLLAFILFLAVVVGGALVIAVAKLLGI